MEQQKISYATLYADSVYLGFEGDLNNPRVIDEHLDVYLLAHQRMLNHLKFNNNLLSWDVQDGADLKISDNIYNYLIDCWNQENQLLQSGKYQLELTSIGYKILLREKNIQSRAPWRPVTVYKGEIHFNDNFMFCYTLHANYYNFEYTSEFFNFASSQLKKDGYGIASLQGIKNKENNLYDAYYISNCCPDEPGDEFKCHSNQIIGPYQNIIENETTHVVEYIGAVKNPYHKHITAFILHYISDTEQ